MANPAAREANPYRFRRKVFHALAGVFLVFLATRAGLLWWEHGQTYARERSRAENLAHVLSEHLERTFGAIESGVRQLAVHGARIGGAAAPPREWSRVLAATLSGLSGVGSLNVLDADGRVVWSTNPLVTGTSRRGRYLHRRLKDEPTDGLVIGPAAPAEHIGGVRIPIGLALRDARGNFTGFVAATFQPERLRGFYEAIDVGPRGVIEVLRADGDLLFSQPHSSRPGGASPADRTILDALAAGAVRGYLRTPIEAGGDGYLTAWRALSRRSLIVAVSIAEGDALAGWFAELYVVAASAGGMALLLALAGVWIMASSRAHARALTELGRGEAQFRAVIDNLPSGIVLRDPEGRERLGNRTIREWNGPAANDGAAGAAGADPAEGDRAVLETGRVDEREREVAFGDGATRRVVSTRFPVRFDDGTVWVGEIVTDVTAAREAEEKLHQVQKLDAVGQLTGGVAHDFNNLLTVIVGNLGLLADRVARDDDMAHRLLETARRAALRGADLTYRLLAFSRRQPIDPVASDVNRLIGDCRELLLRTLGAGIEIEFRPGGDVWAARIDRNQFESVLVNLAINARDAMPGGGRLIVETANETLGGDYAADGPGIAPGPYVAVSVSDTGAGMPPEVLRRAFEPFFTTKPVGKGTGLGLSMVYGFARQAGGDVRIYSEPGHGTTVRLYLPRAESPERAEEAAPAPAGALPRGTETVLIVEDNEDVAAFAAEVLERQGYRVARAADGPAALRLLDGLAGPDLVLRDAVLPGGMNGREAAAAIRARRPAARIVFVSGYAESIVVHQGQLDRGVDFLAKPFAREDLARRVRASLDGPAPDS